LALFQHSLLIEKYLPELALHLQACNINATMYASQWFLTLFSYSVPLSLVFRIIDLIFADGAMVTLMRISFVLLQKNKSRLMSKPEMESVLPILKGRELLEIYGNNLDEVITDSLMLTDIISYQLLEDLKVRYVDEEHQHSIGLIPRSHGHNPCNRNDTVLKALIEGS
jgi:hypothetical protein